MSLTVKKWMHMNVEGSAVQVAERPKILLVEDDPGVRRSLQLLLQAKGLDVRAHASGATLLTDAASMDAACFIADYQLDELDGLEILSRLRARGWVGPAVLITAFPSPGLSERAAAQGFDVVIDKPFREYTFVDAVVRLIARGASRTLV